jgi:predicted nucleic acid-binding protein
MYLLDTNIVSELRKASSNKADKRVLAWANSVSASDLFISVISILELERGILLLERRDSLQGKLLRTWLTTHVLPVFSNRILPLDTVIAQRCAKLHVPDKRPDHDAIIAATALVHGMIVVTRNIEDFLSMDVEILNPWQY